MSIPQIPLISQPLKSLKTPPTPPSLIRMADRANDAVQKPLSIQRTLFSPSCNSEIANPAPIDRSISLYHAPRVDKEAQEIFTPYKDFETWSNLTFLPCPYDHPPTKQCSFSPDEEDSDPVRECVTLFLCSPMKNAVVEAEVNPQTPQQLKRKRAFTENSPSTPLLSPEAREKFGKIASPLWTHNASNFNKKARNSKEKMKFKQELKKLTKKPVHTFEVGSPTKSAAIQTMPDKEGRLKHKGRYLRLHEPAVDAKDPAVKKPNRIIPTIGPYLIRQSGAMSNQMVTDYLNSRVDETFNEFLTRECPRMFATLHPNSTQTLETTGLDFVEA